MKQSNSFNQEYIKPTKIPFKNEEEISIFSDKQKIRTTLSEKLKKTVQAEGMWYQVKIYTQRDEEHLKWKELR